MLRLAFLLVPGIIETYGWQAWNQLLEFVAVLLRRRSSALALWPCYGFPPGSCRTCRPAGRAFGP